MSDINITSEPCACTPGKCAAMFGDDDRGGCINRMTGDVRTLPCEKCRASTWHRNGECCRCQTEMSDGFEIAGPYKYPHDAHSSYNVYGPQGIIASLHILDGDMEFAVDRARILIDGLRAQAKTATTPKTT